MQARQKDGRTLKEHLESVWRQTRRKPKELEDAPILPEMFVECWQWFLRLNNKRTSNGFGVNPISYQEIQAFFGLLEYIPHDWELYLLEQFDVIMLNSYVENIPKEKSKQPTGKSKR